MMRILQEPRQTRNERLSESTAFRPPSDQQ